MTRSASVPDFPERLRTLLHHMILSHHGELEFGSPKVPLFPEALLLHHIDNMDSKMECMRASSKGTVSSMALDHLRLIARPFRLEKAQISRRRSIRKSELANERPLRPKAGQSRPMPAASGADNRSRPRPRDRIPGRSLGVRRKA